jgi:hypothetical protein
VKKEKGRKRKKGRKRRAPAGNLVIASKMELARLFDVHATTIDKWRARGMPGEGRRWPLREIIPWREQHWAKVARRAQESADPGSRLKRYRAKMVRLDLQIKRSKYVLAEDHLDFVRDLCRVFRARLLSLSASLPGQVRGLEQKQAAEVIRDRVYEILEDVSRNAGNGTEEAEAKAP